MGRPGTEAGEASDIRIALLGVQSLLAAPTATCDFYVPICCIIRPVSLCFQSTRLLASPSCSPAPAYSPDFAEIKLALGLYGTPDGTLGFLPTCLMLPMPQGSPPPGFSFIPACSLQKSYTAASSLSPSHSSLPLLPLLHDTLESSGIQQSWVSTLNSCVASSK